MGTFFFILPFLFFLSKISIFSYKKKEEGKKRYCGRLTGHNCGHPLDRKQTFFKGVLTVGDVLTQEFSGSNMSDSFLGTYLCD